MASQGKANFQRVPGQDNIRTGKEAKIKLCRSPSQLSSTFKILSIVTVPLMGKMNPEPILTPTKSSLLTQC